jgi:hypothetical protein
MPTRVLQHGFAPTIENVGLEPGLWNDIPKHGQFLLDLEFITRYTNPQGASCIYRKSPPYLKEIASQFPWVHFYAYEHTEPCKSINPEDDTSEYDPDRPEILMADVPLLVEVNSNMTTSKMKLTNSIARRLSEASAHGCKVLICHGANHDQQLCLHSILKPSSSLLDISGNIPADYYEGEIILPIFIPNNKIFACLAVSQNARCKFYNPSLYQDEIGKNGHKFHTKFNTKLSLTADKRSVFSGGHPNNRIIRQHQQRRNHVGVCKIYTQNPRLSRGYPQTGTHVHCRYYPSINHLINQFVLLILKSFLHDQRAASKDTLNEC